MQISHFPDFHDIPARRLAYAASVMVLGMCLLAFFLEIELKKDVQAEIVASGEVKVQRLSGLVTRVHVQAGMPVDVGTPLFELERDLSLTHEGATRAEASLEERQLRLAAIARRSQLQRVDLRARIAALGDTLTQRRRMHALNEDDIAQARQQVEQARKTLGRLQSVAQYVELDRIERAEAELASRQDNLSRRLARRAELAGEINNAESGIREAQTELAKVDLQDGRERLEAREAFEKNRSTLVVSSPTQGKVAFSQVTPGKYLREEDIAMAISADGQRVLQAVLRIPSRQRGFVREGQDARLKLDAFPYARFGTYAVRIDSISANTVAAPRPSPTDPRGLDSDYLAVATLAQPFFESRGQRHQILPGMQATAAIVVERRSIAEWILQPLFEAIRG